MAKKLLLLSVLTLACVQLALAQRTITGTVTDATAGFELPGVNISVEGTTRGTATGVDGTYSIEAATGEVLVFSFVGYLPQQVTVADQSVIDVALQEDVELLEEIVVVGYGEQQAGDVTGVINKVDAEQFNKGTIVSPDQLISGKVAGVQITPSTGEPGGQSYIRIRGGTSINASNDPLFVIDGVPIDNDPHSPGGFSSGRNPLNFINPSDIENMTVLKDASATSIYGSRGANGVIIITTKKGSRGEEGRITYDGSVSFANVIGKTDVLGADAFRQVVAEQAPERLNLLGSADTDWQETVLDNALAQNHALSFAGGSEKIRYRASLNYLDQEGIIETSNTRRTSLAVSYNHLLLDDRLIVDANVKGARTDDRFAPGGTVGNAASFAPTQPIADPGNVYGGFWEWSNDLAPKNPVAEYTLTEDVGNTSRSLGNVQFEYLPVFLEGLSARLNLGYDVSSGQRKRFAPSILRSQFADNGEVRRATFNRTSTLLDAYVNYDTQFDRIDSKIDVTGGYSYQEFNSEFPEFRAWNLSSDLLGFFSTSPATQHTSFVTEIDNRLISFFGRVNYAFKNRYLLTFTARRDGSSRFGPQNRWGIFPSAAVAWRISSEGFMQGLSSVLSDLKLRGSWGITGNQEIGDFRYLQTYAFSDNQAQAQFGDEYVTTLRPSGVDPNLKWEETTSYNLGLDYELFGGRLSGSLEYYNKQTDDLLFETAVPAGSNLTNIILTNIGSVENVGFEFNVNGEVVDTPAFSWSAGFNASTNRNEVIKLNDTDDPGFEGFATGGIGGGVGNTIQILREGEAANAFFVFRHKRGPDGTPLPDAVDHNGDGEVNLADIYQDTNGDGVVNDRDKVPFKSPHPSWIFGHTTQLRLSNFDASFTLRAQLGNYVYNNVASNFGNFSRVITDSPRNLHASVLETGFSRPQLFSDYYVEDASFLRMDNITLGYSFGGLPGRLNRLRVYATVQNVFVLTGYSGPDPEVGNIGGQGGDSRIGIDDNIFPRSRTFTTGINIEF